LAEPAPQILPLLKATTTTDMVTPLSSSHTLRLLENQNASSLIVHLGQNTEHRLPVLKLIRRQSDLSDLPVAVLAEDWSDEASANWLSHGADLLARPAELPAVLRMLRGGAAQHVCRQAVNQSLVQSTLGDDGQPSPLAGPKVFERLVSEHGAVGDRMAYGVIELTPEKAGHEQDVSEAGVYLAMAVAGPDVIFRYQPNVFIVAMPYADKYYAGRTMRTLKTLIEDLKFGEEPNPVLITGTTAAIDGTGLTLDQVVSELRATLLQQSVDAALSLA
jgi:hypothetical protein